MIMFLMALSLAMFGLAVSGGLRRGHAHAAKARGAHPAASRARARSGSSPSRTVVPPTAERPARGAAAPDRAARSPRAGCGRVVHQPAFARGPELPDAVAARSLSGRLPCAECPPARRAVTRVRGFPQVHPMPDTHPDLLKSMSAEDAARRAGARAACRCRAARCCSSSGAPRTISTSSTAAA